ncbi:MAG: hypothetical protein HY377_01250 [Candidatus Blackburnbacteria bacterium]|nr:hypothetical protein [Candidatus Blackburnbacteria bacterium]
MKSTRFSHQKTAFLAARLVSRTDSLNDWIDTLKSNIAHKESIVNMPEAKLSMDLPGVEPGRLGVSTQSSEPARPMLPLSIANSFSVSQPLIGGNLIEANGQFTVGIKGEQLTDVKFNFLIVN